MYDLIIRHGRVIDNYNNIDEITDVAVDGGRIAGVGDFSGEKAAREFDATGYIVSPGLFDAHVHSKDMTDCGVTSFDAYCFTSGVTSVVEAGSLGCGNYEAGRAHMAASKVKFRAMLSVTSLGLLLTPGQPEENINPKNFDKKKIEQLIKKYPNEIVALKIRDGREKSEESGCVGNEAVEGAAKLAHELGIKLVVHCTDPSTCQADILKCLEKDDILTHFCTGVGEKYSGLLDENGKVRQEAWDARKRGVWFDDCSGNTHHSFFISQPAVEQGFWPDSIATDGTDFSAFYSRRGGNLNRVMARWFALGMDLKNVLACVTSNPAKIYHLDGKVGCLSVGVPADIAIFKEYNEPTEVEDHEGVVIECPKCLQCKATIADGKFVWNDFYI